MAGAGHEVVSVVQQESGAVEHHGDAVDGGWTPFTAFGQCSVQCKTGVQCRTRSCTAPAAVYGGTACTGIDRECNMCQIFTFAWVVGPPSGNCLAADGAPVCGTGIRRRAVTCERCGERVADSHCPPETKPADTEPCSDYFYVRGYGECVRTACGKGIREEGSCRWCDDTEVSLDFCAGSPPLEHPVLPCDGEAVTMSPFGFVIGPWDHDDSACLKVRDCSTVRRRPAYCTMCDGRHILEQFPNSDLCFTSNWCLRTALSDFEALAPIHPWDYSDCDSSSFHHEFPRLAVAVGSDKKEPVPFSAQKCPCGAYSKGYWVDNADNDEEHPTWWHSKRCTGHASRCQRQTQHRTLINRVWTVRADPSTNVTRPHGYVRLEKDSWDDTKDVTGGSVSAYYNLGTGVSNIDGYAWVVRSTTKDETEACHDIYQKTEYAPCQSGNFMRFFSGADEDESEMYLVWKQRMKQHHEDEDMDCVIIP